MCDVCEKNTNGTNICMSTYVFDALYVFINVVHKKTHV